MTKITRNFIAGKMNKIVDQRLLPEGEYVDAMNVRMGDTEKSEVGVIENTKGNVPLTKLFGVNGVQLSLDAKCIGSIEDSANETIYWFVHDKSYTVGATGKCDLIVSYNILTSILTYHVISIDDGSGTQTTLNFNDEYVITGVNIINNLLFFTDYFNQPRFINKNRNYANPVGLIDQVTAEELLVIKRPPLESPTVIPYKTNGQENYLETRFISFAYRYRYIDGEYSATSQWSQVAFVPKPFQFSINSMLNDGMLNEFNATNISYNSGSNLVVGIDLLFKESANNVIKIIEKLDKTQLGITDNTIYTYSFDNSKIFTILADSELLRLYDNVPRLAKAQTIMGNRLMYGNYIEGYNLEDNTGSPVKLEYYVELISNPIGNSELLNSQQNGNYTIDTLHPQTITNAITVINLTGVPLEAGSSLNMQVTITHSAFSGTPIPTATTSPINIDFNFYLSNSYTSVYDMATSPEFLAAVGTVLNIKPVATACTGTTFTDNLNCLLPQTLGTYQKYASGISSAGQPIYVIAFPASDLIGFQFPAMQYVDNVITPTNSIYEYYTVSFTSVTFQQIANPESLHSNRGYEVGIVYMDEFNRSSTALVSPYNNLYVPCGYSSNKNSIQVTIPSEQKAPYWATRYKFVIKPDTEFYETIYCTMFFRDPNSNSVWFLLEGENMEKVEVGDKLIVKSDTSGTVINCAYATVLEKDAKIEDFIIPDSGSKVPAGVYMKINPSTFDAIETPNSTITEGQLVNYGNHGSFNVLNYPMNISGTDISHPTWTYLDYTIPAGSKIELDFKWDRGGTNSVCEHQGCIFKKTFVATSDYNNMEDWWNGDNITATLASAVSTGGNTTVHYIAGHGVLISFVLISGSPNIMYIQFNRDIVTNKLYLQLSTGYSCTGGDSKKRRYYVYATVTVFRALDNLIFETQPSDALPDVFYENNLSFGIDSNGNHLGNLQDQDISIGQPAIVDTGFFNCFAFGNGAESYKINDSLKGRYFTLGERVTTVSEQDYKEANRFSDITYSGIYNAETNLNKLNEFNLGLINYKHLETSFGNIYILDGRETDVLVLQEDKISYVLAGKNLLSDAAAGGAITSIPEVLGTQIARIEKYGISFNPESYVQWGYDRFFTDIKRGAVINIKGDSVQQDQLTVISELSMRTWFRDEFNTSFNTQKLGAYDPYMNEYVLSTNDVLTPVNNDCIQCGISQTLNLSNSTTDEQTFNVCVNLGTYVGESTLNWNVLSNTSGELFTINVTYDGNIYSYAGSASGNLIIPKNNILVETAQISIEYTSPSLIIDLTANCPVKEELTIVEVVLTNNEDVGEDTHIQYRYTNGSFIGALQSSSVTFSSGTTPPIVSRYNAIIGYAGSGGFPPELSTMSLQSNTVVPDSYIFDPLNDKFRWLRSNILYSSSISDINDLLSLAHTALPITGSSPLYSANFTVPTKVLGEYLYLIWDYRHAMPMPLCYAPATDPNPRVEACCDCIPCNTDCVTISIHNPIALTSEVLFPAGDSNCSSHSGALSVEIAPLETITLCVNNDFSGSNMWSVISGYAQVTILNCGCTVTPCAETCSQWYYINTSTTLAAVVDSISCSDCITVVNNPIAPNQIGYIKACKDTTPNVIDGDTAGLILSKYCGICVKPENFCLTWEFYDIVGATDITYKTCPTETDTVLNLVGSESPFTICVTYPYIPIISIPQNAKMRLIPNDCNCYISS